MKLKTFWFKKPQRSSKLVETVVSFVVFGIFLGFFGGWMIYLYEAVIYGKVISPAWSINQVGASFLEEKVIKDKIKIPRNLLGFSKPATYLILLMNKGEARPLGGFWGSFAQVEVVSGAIKEVVIHDAYWPPSVKKEYFCDDNLKNIWFSACVSFVDSSRVGFTDYDGKVVKTIYEKTFSGSEVAGVIFVRSDLFEYLIPDYRNYHFMREFWNATSPLREGKPNKNKYRKFINNFVKAYQTTLAKRVLELLWENPDAIKWKILIYIPTLKDELRERQRPYLSGGFYWFDTDRSFTKGWSFVNRQVYLWDNNHLKYIGDGGALGVYTGETVHIRVIYEYDFELQAEAKKLFKKLETTLGLTLPDKTKYVLGYFPYIKSLSHFYYPSDYQLVKSSLKDYKNSKWQDSNVVYFTWDKKFTTQDKELVVDFWLEQKKFLK